MTTEDQEVTAKIRELNSEYKELTGHDAYLYAYAPEDRSTRFVFATNQHHFRKVRALSHMQDVLALAKHGRTHDQILYGMPRE